MIKINLARMSDSAAPMHVEASAVAGGPTQPAGVATKILLILVIPIALYVWEGTIISGKIERMNISSKKLEEIRGQVTKLGAVTAVVKSLEDEKERLQKQLAVVGKISRKRAFKLRTIAEMQKSLPDDCWLDEVNISKDSVSFTGYARTPSSVQKLVEGLKELDYLSSAFNKELKRKKIGAVSVHEFVVVAEVKR